MTEARAAGFGAIYDRRYNQNHHEERLAAWRKYNEEHREKKRQQALERYRAKQISL